MYQLRGITANKKNKHGNDTIQKSCDRKMKKSHGNPMLIRSETVK